MDQIEEAQIVDESITTVVVVASLALILMSMADAFQMGMRMLSMT